MSPHIPLSRMSGGGISFDNLPIPCEARVSYYRKPKESYRYVAVTIEVLGEPQPNPE